MSSELSGEAAERRTVAAPGLRRLVGWGMLTLALLALGLWNLEGPQMWWDEGWTLSVARHWVEDGHYGRLRDGQPIAPGLAASFTTTLPVGLSMHLLGVGIWQGRVFGVLCATAVVLLLAALAARLYNQRIAVATVFAALLLTIHPQIQPLLQGRQVLAEMPMLLYLLAGYLCLWWALSGRPFAVLPAALLLGTAWISKGQTAPFLLASLAITALAALAWRRWAVAAMLAAVIAGAYATARLLPQLVYSRLIEPGLPSEPVEGLLGLVAVVLTPFHRIYALQNLLSFGLPAVLGVLWGLWVLWRDGKRDLARAVGHWSLVPGPARHGSTQSSNGVFETRWFIRLALLAFCAGWLAWFVALSVGVPRYLSPPVVVASIFVAALLHDLTGGFDIAQSLRALADLLMLRHLGRRGLAALLAMVLTVGALALTTLGLLRYYPEDDRAARRVAAVLNALPAGTRVETYESELHFLLDQPYTYPPDQLHVALGLRSLRVDPDAPVVYDVFANNPDYLVVGRNGRDYGLYEPALAGGAFRLVREDGLYEVYERAP